MQMGIELIKPIDSDTAHAIEEAAKRVRLSFIGILKQLDPLDALCLRALDEKKDSVAREEWHPMLMTRFAASADEIQVSIDKLRELHLVEIVGQPKVIALGKLFLAGVED